MKADMSALTFLILLSCTPYGHWGSYGWWRDNCPGFPSYEEVEQVLEEHKGLIERLMEERLIYKMHIFPCPDGAFISSIPRIKSVRSKCWTRPTPGPED